MRLFIGVDVGADGGIAAVDEAGSPCNYVRMPATDRDIFEIITELRASCEGRCRASLEKVHSSPQMGVKSAFSFGGSYRGLRMALTAANISFDEVNPQVWQRRMGCLTGGDKNVSKQRAQQLFPGVKMTHLIADALLLAEFCRRQEMEAR